MRYTIIHHEVRGHLGLTPIQYMVCDSIHQLSHGAPTKKTLRQIGAFLGIDHKSVLNSLRVLHSKGLVAQVDGGWTSTQKWQHCVTFLSGNGSLGKNSPNPGKNSPTDNIYIKNITNKERMSWKNQQHGDDYLEGEVQIDPDFQPPQKSKKVKDEIQAVFDLFSNPARAIWRLRPIEREAAKALLEEYGMETLTKRIKRIEIEKTKGDPFFPHVDTPSQLLSKMGNIERYLGI